MQMQRMNSEERKEFIWQWDLIKDFPGILCKQLLWPDGDYWLGWAMIETADEFLAIQLRNHSKSKCLTPKDQSHSLGSILQRMDDTGWTFARLASDEWSEQEVPRNKQWFQACVDLDAKFDLDRLGIIALHPRQLFKEQAVQGDAYDLRYYEIYEGLHRALILAKRARENPGLWRPLKMLYLYPDRET